MTRRETLKALGLGILSFGLIKPSRIKATSNPAIVKTLERIEIEQFITKNVLIPCDYNGTTVYDVNTYGEFYAIIAQATIFMKENDVSAIHRHRFQSQLMFLNEITEEKQRKFTKLVNDWCYANKDKFKPLTQIPPKLKFEI